MYSGIEIPLKGYLRCSGGFTGMAEEKILEFSCPIRIKLILPYDCVLDEKALKERIDQFGPQLFMGLCDACPHYQARSKESPRG